MLWLLKSAFERIKTCKCHCLAKFENNIWNVQIGQSSLHGSFQNQYNLQSIAIYAPLLSKGINQLKKCNPNICPFLDYLFKLFKFLIGWSIIWTIGGFLKANSKQNESHYLRGHRKTSSKMIYCLLLRLF